MRLATVGILSLCGLMAAPLAFAQSAAPSGTTTQDIICKMSDTCGDTESQAQAPSGPTRALGDEKKFSFQVTPDTTQPKSSAARPAGDEKKFSLQLANDKAPAPVAKPQKAAKGQPAYYAAATGRKAAAPAASHAVHAMTMQVQFEVGSAELTDGAKTELAKYATAMKDPKLSAMTFEIGGHTDSSGRRATNVDLSQRRAQTVVDYLAGNGIAQDHLVAKGYGPDKPLAGTSKRDPANRRVELVRVD